MEYIEFCDSILSELRTMLGDDYTVNIDKIHKNNGVSYDAAVILKKDNHMAPSVWLDEYFNQYREGRNIAEIALSIIVQYERYRDEISFDIEQMTEYDSMKDSIYVKVVNSEMNYELLKSMPHVVYYDLAMSVYAVIEDIGDTRVTMNVTYGNIRLWNISKEKLFEDAINNTRKELPPYVTKMSDVMKELLVTKLTRCDYQIGEDSIMDKLLVDAIEAIEASERQGIYMLSNSKKLNGAVYMLFNDVLERIADIVESDIFVIPSSIHEILILPKSENVDYGYLCDMVKYVNNKDLDPMEILSDKVYVYERGKGMVWENSVK